jgi:hypothetical protein
MSLTQYWVLGLTGLGAVIAWAILITLVVAK